MDGPLRALIRIASESFTILGVGFMMGSLPAAFYSLSSLMHHRMPPITQLAMSGLSLLMCCTKLMAACADWLMLHVTAPPRR